MATQVAVPLRFVVPLVLDCSLLFQNLACAANSSSKVCAERDENASP
jgi:hypothetical protein